MSMMIVRAFHYTRMTDDEVDRLQAGGVVLTSVDFLRERLGRRVEAGDLSQELADQIVSRTALANAEFGVRDGFWLTALPIPPADSRVNLLVQHWGGEGAYWAFETGSEDQILETLRGIGRGRIVEFQVPIKSALMGETGAGTATNMLDVYASRLGILRYPRDLDLNLVSPLPASAVLKVHSQGEREYDRFAVGYPFSFARPQ
ncbi:hypothetical protein [Pseudorhizobium flavum]|uniref:hypothetical protein n=1 Tax=Pseudorhizobium flavum TaxID=1335061 RepID=UPI00377048E9